MILLLLILSFIPVQADKPNVTCTVTTSGAVCETRNPAPECKNSKHKLCVRTVLDIPDSAWEDVFSEWVWRVEDHPSHWNFPLVRERPKAGAKVRAVLDANGQIVPLAACKVRIHRRVNEWAAKHPGALVPMTVMAPPQDCQNR